jgi:hypothetical protein
MKHRKVFIVVALLLALSLVAIAPAQVSGDCGGCPECPPPPPPPPPPPCGGDEGCTPGYWKNLRKHGDEWAAAGISLEADFDGTFGVDLFTPDITLGDAVRAKGGGVNALARHATAALLSAAHSGVDYPVSVADVIELVKARDKDTLEGYNELGCPLN